MALSGFNKYVIVFMFMLPVILAAEWKLMWSPNAQIDGLSAFEGIEDEPSKGHKVKHIFPQGENYRFEMHMRDRDSVNDRQRQEVRGMRKNGQNLWMKKGETWKLTYSMFIPSSLKATKTFTHIFQIKGYGSPLYVMSLRRRGNVEQIEPYLFDEKLSVASVDLKPIHDKWLKVEFEYKGETAGKGYVKVAIFDGNKRVLYGEKKGVTTFARDPIRPKWGIYRQVGPESDQQQLMDTYFMIKDLKGYKLV